jgi:hypothetical protein
VIRRFETHSFPSSLAATLRGFTLYLADPVGSIHRLNQIRFKFSWPVFRTWNRSQATPMVRGTDLAIKRQGRSRLR